MVGGVLTLIERAACAINIHARALYTPRYIYSHHCAVQQAIHIFMTRYLVLKPTTVHKLICELLAAATVDL